MTEAIHPAASHHLPIFITPPGQTDVLMGITLVMVIAIIVGIGVFYFRLHALPEQIAHQTDKIQFQVVAVLGLLALFTHNHAYWIAALLLAMIRLPDFTTPLTQMASSLGRMAEGSKGKPTPTAAVEPPAPKRAAKKPAKPAPAEAVKETGDV